MTYTSFFMKSYKYSFAAILVLCLVVLGAGCGSSSAPVNPPTGTRTTPTPAPQPAQPSRPSQPSQPSQPARQPVSETPTPLPAGVPSDIPTAPNSEIINTSNDPARKIVTLTLSSPDRSDRVFASMSAQLTRNGFSQTSDSALGNTRTIVFKKGTVTMSITLIQEVDVTNYQVSREE